MRSTLFEQRALESEAKHPEVGPVHPGEGADRVGEMKIMRSPITSHRGVGESLVLVLALVVLAARSASAQPTSIECARRVGTVLNLTYWGSEAARADAGTMQDRVPSFMQRGEFVARWGAFVSSRVNAQPGETAEDDVMLAAIRFVFENNRPWKDVFVGRFGMKGPSGYPVVVDAPDQPPYGFFGLAPWLKRYAGNASDGHLLQASNRILLATIGFKLTPSPQNAIGDNGRTGRERAECRSCHYDSPYALDHVAALLPWARTLANGQVKVVPQTPTPQVLFNGQTFNSFDELLQTLVGSDAFLFWSCRLAFEFSVGRPESGCEADLFDRCVDTLRETQDIRAAIASIMQHPSYCSELSP